jgi:hypothetical protein
VLNGPWVCNAEVCESPVHAPLPAPVMAHASAEREHPIAISALTRLAAPDRYQQRGRGSSGAQLRFWLANFCNIACVPEEVPPPASPGTSDADTVSTALWRFCGGPCTGSARPPALLASAPFALVLARGSPPRTPCIGSFDAGAGRGSPPRTPCIGSFGAGAGRGSAPRTPCIRFFGAGARRLLAPAHSLHVLLSRWCWQRLAPRPAAAGPFCRIDPRVCAARRSLGPGVGALRHL